LSRGREPITTPALLLTGADMLSSLLTLSSYSTSVEAAECNATEQASTIDCAHQTCWLKSPAARSCSQHLVRRAGVPRVSDVRHPGSPPGCRMWLGSTHNDRLRCAASQRYVRMCFDKQMAALSARSVGRSVVGACPPARCARARGACTCQPRNTCLGSAGAGRSSWYAFGWLALSRVGSIFERQDVSMQLYAGGLGLTSSMGMYYCSSSPWSIVG
jgi:hypothetical protein